MEPTIPVFRVDFDRCALGNVDRRTPSADHRREAELAGHDGRVAERATLFDDECAEQGKEGVDRRADECGDEHVAGLELFETLGRAGHDAGPAAVDLATDAEAVEDLLRRGRSSAFLEANQGPMVAWVIEAIVNEIRRGNPPPSVP